MAVPANVICAWPSTAASIPAGWTRETNLDAVFIQGAQTGADADLTTARGNSSHTHTSPPHTPIQNPHSHFVSSSTYAGNNCATGPGSSIAAHSHNGNTPNTTAVNTASTVNFTANTSNDPLFTAVIWIKSDGTPVGIPVGAYAFFSSDSLPAGWSRVQGNQYLKGAVAAGDGGGTGGAATHTHTSDVHTHGQSSHTHAAFDSGAGTPSGVTPATDATSVATTAHVHHLTLSTDTGSNQSTTNTTDAVNQEPINKKYNVISNGNGGPDLPNQVVLVWGGSNATIPTGWARETALDGFFLKGANADGESGSTGGSLHHTHVATCQPLQNTHNHTVTAATGNADVTGTEIFGGATPRESTDVHTHIWTSVGIAPINQLLSYSVDVCADEAAYPLYRRVIFIKLSAPTLRTILTSYDAGILPGQGMNLEVVAKKLTDEQEHKIWHGDRRYYPQV